MEKNKDATEQYSWYQQATRIVGIFVILIAVAGVCGSTSGYFTTFLFFEGIATMFLGYGIQVLFFGGAPTRSQGGISEYDRYSMEIGGSPGGDLERVKRAPEILISIMVAGLLAFLVSLIFAVFSES